MQTWQDSGARIGARVVGTRAWAIGAIIVVGLISGLKAGVVPGDELAPAVIMNDAPSATVPGPSSADDTRPIALDALDAGDLRLHAVVHGRDALANVNGHVVKLGQVLRIDGTRYTVSAIAAKSVTLTTDAGAELVLRLRSWQVAARR